MKKYLILALCLSLTFSTTIYAQQISQITLEQEQPLLEGQLSSENQLIPEEEWEKIYSDYTVDLDNLYKYNIIALQNADINCHVRGSIWIGGVLTGSQYIDDGSISGISESESYVYDNQSSLYFQSRTENQSLDAYKNLTDAAVTSSIDYWTRILLNFPNDGVSYIYIQPDENGCVDLKKWDYEAIGSDETKQEIPKVYWTDATYVEMGGLAGHLIAPYADIHIVSCNHRGSIVGWNIFTDGESHINYWTPDLKGETVLTPTPTEAPKETPTPIPTPIPTITSTIPRPTPIPTEGLKPPQTGDSTNSLYWLILLVVSCMFIIITKAKNIFNKGNKK